MPQTPVQLSERQMMILVAIGEAVRDRGLPPAIRELGRAVGVSSTSVMAYHLRKIELAGYVRREPNVSRGLTLTEAGASWLAERGVLDAPHSAHARALTPTEAAHAAAEDRFEAASSALAALLGAQAIMRVDLAAAQARLEAAAARSIEAAAPEDGGPPDSPAMAAARQEAIAAKREVEAIAGQMAALSLRVGPARADQDAAARDLAALLALPPRREAARDLEAAAAALRAAVAHLDRAAEGPARQRKAVRKAGVAHALGKPARVLPSSLTPRGRERRRILEAAAALEAAALEAVAS